MRARWLRGKVFEVLGELINAHLADTLSVSASDIDAAVAGLFLSSDHDVVPLIKLCVSDLFVELGVGAIHIYLEALFVQVEHYTMAVV